MASKWEPADPADICPRCTRRTELLINHDGEHAMIDAERCKPCGWVIRFDDDDPDETRAEELATGPRGLGL